MIFLELFHLYFSLSAIRYLLNPFQMNKKVIQDKILSRNNLTLNGTNGLLQKGYNIETSSR